MHSQSTRLERVLVGALLLALVLILMVAGFELVKSLIVPEALSSLIGGEGPSSERCAYQSIKSYRVSNALLAGLSLCGIVLSIPISAAKRRILALLPVLALIVTFGYWYEWGCRSL